MQSRDVEGRGAWMVDENGCSNFSSNKKQKQSGTNRATSAKSR